ncbi:hypothetical protein [Saliphagus sp. LR7]|uniref:hypothetical protein n=1 Tax=Saliphagus sp. LR7 TaxID=2282654 RepID=UPI000DF77564|nr:hypothetical protein [Saliphagus sp. LR7]
MTDGLYECPSPDCTWTIEGIAGLAEHINENHPGGFTREDWLSFSNPDAVQYGSEVGRSQTISDEETDDETDED